jgi:rhodanese-related sulfurtransferase
MVEEISAERLHERLAAGERVQVVDIRPEPAYERGHIPGAENVPFDRFTQVVDEYDWGEEIVVACPLGKSSLQAARLLESYEGVADGARVVNLVDGYRAWEYDLEPAEA